MMTGGLTWNALLLCGTLANMAMANPSYQLVNAPLDKAEVDKFLSCVKASDGAYNMMVEDDGEIVISPTAKRAIDFKKTDEKLYECMKEASTTIKLAAESNLYPGQKDILSIGSALVDYEYLESQNALGRAQEPVNLNSTAPGKRDQIKKSAKFSKRENTHWFFYQDDDKGCGNLDVHSRNLRECYTGMSKSLSYKCENVNDNKHLVCTIWPHHDCKNGDDKSYTVPPNTITECHDRTLYSYSAYFK